MIAIEFLCARKKRLIAVVLEVYDIFLNFSMEPNLFNYATSELSQDAFLLWLLEWGNPENKNYDCNLYEISKTFILFLIDESEFFEIESVECMKQYKNIDVLALINKKIAVIIEDKIFTNEHGNQIEKYQSIVQRNLGANCIIKSVYLKTGNECLRSLRIKSQKEKFKIVTRNNLLNVLCSRSCTNVILRDFLDRIKSIENATLAYEREPVLKWSPFAWQGFFLKLENLLCDGEWGWVPHPGKFWGYWWNYRWLGDCGVKLQIEESKVCIKIEDYNNLVAKRRRAEILNFNRSRIRLIPSRRISGIHPTILYMDVKDSYGEGIINLESF